MGKLHLHLIIRGKVQGVFYRAHTIKQARSLGLTGWVMNRTDGSVELIAEGEKKDLVKLLAWCFEGSPGARVENIDISWEKGKGEFSDFVFKKEYHEGI